MKIIRRLETLSLPPLESVSESLDQLEKASIDTVNWKEYDYKPDVRFAIAYNKTELFIKFYVTEDYVRAVNGESNQSVYQDSCVEFFVRPLSDGPYLNFEFNAIGTCLMQRGMNRSERRFIEPVEIAKIRRKSSLGTDTFEERKGKQKWDLIIAIPLLLVFGKEEPELSGKNIRANFYKCGDSLSEVHYLTWNPIPIENPDYHRPDYFGVLEFE